MKTKLKLYRAEKILFIILLLIVIMNWGPYVAREIKMLPIIKSNSNDPSFARLEINTGSPSADRVTSEEGKNSLNKYIETLDEDNKKRATEEIERSGSYIQTNFKSVPHKDKKHLSKGMDFDFVVYGHFKEELTEYGELQFEAFEMYRNLDLRDMKHTSTSYGLGGLALKSFFILIIIDITIRGVAYIYCKIKRINCN